MAALRSPEEVYNCYIEEYGYDGDGDPDAVGLFAYALVEKDRLEWMAHHKEQHNNTPPTGKEIEEWYLSKPSSVLQRKEQSGHIVV